MATAKVFMSGNSQAVRIPKEFRIVGDELEISRDGDRLILSPKEGDMSRAIEIIQAMSDEMFDGIRDERRPEEREEF
jgi:antitoxin VapB